MANHASTRTTQLYSRREDELSLDEVERIWSEPVAQLVRGTGAEGHAGLTAACRREVTVPQRAGMAVSHDEVSTPAARAPSSTAAITT